MLLFKGHLYIYVILVYLWHRNLKFAMMLSRFALVLLTACLAISAQAQDYFRIKASFTVKISNADGTKNLTKGTVYYDKNIKELIYDVSFPQKEKWISKDTSLVKIRDGEIFDRITIPSINEFTLFHLALNSSLNDFGLKNSVFKISKVEKKGDLVLSYWKIPEQASTFMDHVVVARKNNRLESVVMVGDQLKILSKQFYRNYIMVSAFEFPQQIVQIMYDKTGRENYQVTEFSNINLNEQGNNNQYRSGI
jgi:hypothetical protein